MLRINVLEDPDFRKELFTVIEKQFNTAFSHQQKQGS